MKYYPQAGKRTKVREHKTMTRWDGADTQWGAMVEVKQKSEEKRNISEFSVVKRVWTRNTWSSASTTELYHKKDIAKRLLIPTSSCRSEGWCCWAAGDDVELSKPRAQFCHQFWRVTQSKSIQQCSDIPLCAQWGSCIVYKRLQRWMNPLGNEHGAKRVKHKNSDSLQDHKTSRWDATSNMNIQTEWEPCSGPWENH